MKSTRFDIPAYAQIQYDAGCGQCKVTLLDSPARPVILMYHGDDYLVFYLDRMEKPLPSERYYFLVAHRTQDMRAGNWVGEGP